MRIASLARSESVRPRVQILRGKPGSGKSTLAKKYDCLHLELDQFCISGGRYAWTPENDVLAHKWLKRMIADAMRAGIDIVVSGVMPTSKGVMLAILKYALLFGYEVWVKDLAQRFKNKHGCRKCDLERFDALFVPFGKMSFPEKLVRDVNVGLMPRRLTLVPVPTEDAR